MRQQSYEIKLKKKELTELKHLVRRGQARARKLTRARVLLMSHEQYGQGDISEVLSVTRTTIRNICNRYLSEGLDSALNDKPRSGAPSTFNGKHRAKLTMLACTEAPEGHSQWSLQLLADKAVELNYVESISRSQVGRILKKTKSSRTSKGSGA